MLNIKNNFIFLILGMFLISCVSASDFDNSLRYEEDDMKVTLENFWGLPIFGSDLGSIELKSHKTVNDILKFGYGKEEVVMYYDFKDWELYEDGLGKVYFTDKHTNEIIEKDYYFVEWVSKDVKVNDYKEVCSLSLNGTNECNQEISGTHFEKKWGWENYTSNDIPNKNTRIGLKTYVDKGDYIDAVWTIAGKEITKHAEWTASLNVGIIGYWKLNETSGAVIDSFKLQNGSNVGASRGATGIIENAFDFEESAKHYTVLNKTSLRESLSTFTISAWIKAESIPQFPAIISKAPIGDDSSGWWFEMADAPDTNRFVIGTGSGKTALDTTPISTGTWYHIVGTYNGTTALWYQNNTLIDSAVTAFGDENDHIYLATRTRFLGLADRHFDGIIDEVGFWNRSLSAAEVTQLWNDGNAITFQELFAPTVSITFPENITYNESIAVLNYTVTNNSIGDRCWYSIDGGVTNSSDVTFGTNFSINAAGGSNTWIVYCNDTNSLVGQDSITFFVNKSVSTDLISPVDNSNFTITVLDFLVNSTPINTNLTNVTLYIWYSNDTLLLTNTTTLSGSNEIQTNFTQNFPEGNFKWNAETCGEDINCNFAISNNSFIIHLTSPTINISAPTGVLTYVINGDNLTLEYNISEEGQNLTEHLDQCWYKYNNINTSLNCSENNTNFTYVEGINNLTVYANDTFGLLVSDITNWSILFEKYNVTFDNQTFEGSQETFTAEIILGGGETISQAIFYYNDTNYTTNIIFSGGEYTVTSTIVIPSVESATNLSLGFYIVVGGQTYNLETFEQEVININISLCGVGDNLLLNASLFDEKTKLSIFGDIEMNAQAISKTSNETSALINLSFENVTSGAICLSPIEAFENLYFGTEIRYSSANHVPEFFYIQRADMADYPRNLSLFDLATNESTEFEIQYQDDSLIPLEGAIVQLQRKYISEDSYEIVEAPLTSNEGKAIVHIDLNTNKYRATIVKDGEVLDFFDNLVFNCENELSGQCTQLLLGKIDSQNDVSLIELNDFTALVSSVNNTITTSFAIPSGTPASVNILLTQLDQFGNKSQCNQTIISSGGSIDCTYDDTIGDSYLTLEISKDEVLQAQESYMVYEDSGIDFLGNNFFIVFIFLLSVVGMAFSSPEWIILNAVVVMLFSGAFWLLNGLNFVMGLGSIMWLIVAAGILIKELSKQEDR